MSYQPTACSDCLRRARLLAELAPYIEKGLIYSAQAKLTTQLLTLANDDLIAAVAPEAIPRLPARLAAVSEDELQTEIAESRYVLLQA